MKDELWVTMIRYDTQSDTFDTDVMNTMNTMNVMDNIDAMNDLVAGNRLK